MAQYIHNSWPNETTRKTPFELIMGHVPQIPTTSRTTLPLINEGLEQITQARNEAKEGTKGLARSNAPQYHTPQSQITTKALWTLKNHKYHQPHGLSAGHPGTMETKENTPSFPHLTADTLSRDRSIWDELRRTTT